MRNLKRALTVKPKDNAINRDPQELQDPHLAPQTDSFWLFGNGI